jgi:hypothetical protein
VAKHRRPLIIVGVLTTPLIGVVLLLLSSSDRVIQLDDLSAYEYSLSIRGYGTPLIDYWSLSSVISSSIRTFSSSSPIAVDIAGAYVRPRAGRFDISTNDSVSHLEVTNIGDQSWVKIAGNVGKSSINPSRDQDYSLAVPIWTGLARLEKYIICSSQVVSINGQRGLPCSINVPEAIDASGVLQNISWISHSTIAIWMSVDRRYPLRIELKLTGLDIQDEGFSFTIMVDIFHVNDRTIEVHAP